jgi:hypothetical protein
MNIKYSLLSFEKNPSEIFLITKSSLEFQTIGNFNEKKYPKRMKNKKFCKYWLMLHSFAFSPG